MAFNSFGSSNTFGAANKTSGFGFGAAAAPATSSFGFGNKPAQTNTFGGSNTTGGFGMSTPTGGMFGSTAAPTNTFGSPSGGFGKPSTFGTTSSLGGLSGGGGFGMGGGTGFGGAASTGFGLSRGTTSPSTFGTTSAFGTGGNNAFGAPSTLGASSGFGTGTGGFGGAGGGSFGATNTFGGGNTGTGAFGSTNTFGNANTSNTGMFGNTGGSAFGQPAASTGFGGGGFGAASTPAFGQQPTGFGSTFGGGATGFGQQQQQGGTGNPKFSPHTIQETTTKQGHSQTSTLSLQVITGMPAYSAKSLEELRFEDYQRGNKGGQQGGLGMGGLGSTAGGFGGLGAANNSPFKSSLGGFGSAPATTGFGSFGAAATPAATTGFGSFGSAATPAASGFGTGGFGAGATNTFGAPSTGAFGAPSAGAFGAPAGNAFGAPASNGFGAPAAGGFGSTAGTSTAGGFGGSSGFGSTSGFGTTTTPSAFGTTGGTGFGGGSTFGGGAFGQTQPSTGAFGAPSATGTGGFGGGFGSTTGFGQSTTTSGFGAQTQTGFGGNGGFGSTAPATGGFGSFGQPAAGAGTGFGSFGTSGTTPAASSGFGFGSLGGNTAQSGTGAFGAPAAAGGFGSLGGTTGATGFGSLGGSFGTTGGFGAAPTVSGGFGSLGKSTGGFSNFGSTAPATSAFGSGFGLGSQQTGSFGSMGTLGGFGASSGFGMSGQQQQQQQLNMQQQNNVMLQQQQQTIGSKIDLLRLKRNELTHAPTEQQNGGAAAEAQAAQQLQLQQQALVEQKAVSNLFSGLPFEKVKPVAATTLQKSAAASKPTHRVVPRGMSSSLSPAAPTHSSNSAPKQLLLLSAPVAQYNVNSTRTQVADGSSSMVSLEPAFAKRDAKKIFMGSYVSGSIEDPTDDLPPPHHLSNGSRGSALSAAETTSSPVPPFPPSGALASTPARGNMNGIDTAPSSAMNVASAQSTRYGLGNGTSRLGDATGLTPHASATPLAPRHLEEDDTADGALQVPRHISFKSTPQKTTSSSASKSSSKPSPAVQKANPPTLTKDGYFTSPDMSVLRRMTDSELSRVYQFTVYRPHVGKIEWEDETDVRGLDLDAAVRIDKKEVFVYEGVDPPPLGSGLNKPAIVTLAQVFPKAGASSAKVQAYVQKLHEFCEVNDAQFISYDLDLGDWVFAVQHFSRYGLDDSDDEDDQMQEAADEEKSSSPLRSPLRDERYDQQQEYSFDMSMEVSCAPMVATTPSENIQRLRRILTSGQQLVVASVDPVNGSGRRTHDLGEDGRQRQQKVIPSTWARDEDEEEEFPQAAQAIIRNSVVSLENLLRPGNNPLKTAFFPANESLAYLMLREPKEYSAAENVGRPPIIPYEQLKPAEAGRRRGVDDYLLSMKRSFRVGWTADGKIVHSGNMLFSAAGNVSPGQHRVAVESLNPTRWLTTQWDGQSPSEHFVESLSALLDSSNVIQHHADSMDNNSASTPVWKEPLAEPADLDEYSAFLTFVKKTVASFDSRGLSADHPDWTVGKALELVDAAYGQEKAAISVDPSQRAVDMMPLFEDRPESCAVELWERRRTALSKWLESVVAPQVPGTLAVDEGGEGQDVLTYRRIFDLLSCHRIDDAVNVAENAGMFRLATLLSQADGDASLPALMRSQLEIWRYSDAEATIDPDLLRVYKLLGGSAITEDEGQSPSSILSGMGWTRAIGVLFWFCSKSDSFVDNLGTLREALDSYRITLLDGLADPPRTGFADDKFPFGSDAEYPAAKHGLYSLLELLFPSISESSSGADLSHMDEGRDDAALLLDTERKVIACLSPGGFTRDQLDYRASYLLLVLLESAGIASKQSPYSSIVRQHLVFQLLSEGLWEWAVFVALQLPEASARHSLVRDIVLRFGGVVHWEVPAADLAAVSTKALSQHTIQSCRSAQFVTHHLRIPVTWVHEATAYRCGLDGDHQNQVTYLNFAHKWNEAKEVVCIHIAPSAILASDSAARSLLYLLESIESQQQEEAKQAVSQSSQHRLLSGYADTWTDLADIFLCFLRLREFVESLSDEDFEVHRAPDEEVLDSKLNEMLSEAKLLLNRLSAFQRLQLDQRLQHDFQMQSRLGPVVVLDISTYLYKLVSRLVSLTPWQHQDQQERLTLLSGEYFSEESPIHNEALQGTLCSFNDDFFQDAACRVMDVLM